MFKFVKTSLALAAVCAMTIIASACGSGSSAPSSATAAQESPAYASSSAADMEFSAKNDGGGLGGELTSTSGVAEDVPAEEGSETKPPENIRDDRKIIWRAHMQIETLEFDKALAQIEQMVKDKGGYIEKQEVTGAGIESPNYERNAWITARIPSDKLDGFTEGVAGICNVILHTKSSEDITDSYFDASARLETLKIQEERLLEILKKAEKLEDIITLESALSGVRYEIESMTAAIRRMDSQTAFSYMEINMNEVVKYQKITEAPKTFGQELSAAASRSWQHLLSAMRVLTLVLVESLPLMLFWVIIILAIALAVRAVLRRVRDRDRKKYAKKDATAQALPEKPAEIPPEIEKK